MIRVFCDFDGTVALEDVGEQLFLRFTGGRSRSIVEEYLEGRISSHECLRRECEAVGTIDRTHVEAFVDGCDLDPAFKSFARYCEQAGMDLAVVSDGLDFYVKRLLERHGLSHVPFFANHLEFVTTEDGARLVPSFPFRDAECRKCGNCKRNHLVTRSGDDDLIVYVGDGHSDRCAVAYADVVFAKKALIRHCQKQNITYHEFTRFDDVQHRLEAIASRPRLKQRREALMARRKLFMQG